MGGTAGVFDSDGFRDSVYEIVRSIPSGSVLTYGALATLAGHPNRSRMVGRIMSQAPGGLAAHRVVNRAGRTAPGWDGQRELLEGEGVAFLENGCVDMKRHLAAERT